MSRKLPISLCLYLTTKGHWGYKDCYKHTVKNIDSHIPLEDFGSLVAHVKVSSGDNEKPFVDFLEQYGFKVLVTHEDWNRKENNHAEAYFKDMLTVMSDDLTHQNEFVIHQEDDFLWNCNKHDSVFFWIHAIGLLKNDKNLLAVRMNDEINQDVSKSKEIDHYTYRQNLNYTQWGPTLTFQPTIMRTRDWYFSVEMINKYWESLKGQHCELTSGLAMRNFTSSRTPFYFFNPKMFNCQHIGSEEFAKKNGQILSGIQGD